MHSWHYQNACPVCGKNWAEHRSGYSASKCGYTVPNPPTNLQEAIEEVKRTRSGHEFTVDEVDCTWTGKPSEAIATILNAVVKGELK